MIPATPHLTCASHFLDGFHDGVRQAGVEGILVPGLYLNDDPSKFREAARRLAERRPVPDGIVCGIENGRDRPRGGSAGRRARRRP